MPASCPCPCPPRRSGAASAPEPARLPGPSAAVRVEIRTPDGSSKARLRARRNCREKRPVSTRRSYRKTRAERWRARSLYKSCKAHVGTDALLMCGRGGFCRGWICDPDQPCDRELESGTAQAGTAALGRPASPKGWRDLQEAERPDLSRLKTQYARATGLHAASSGQALADRQTQPPLLAIVGRPNVGKSTLFNRLVGSRRAIVGDEPGITRDRLYGDSEWRGRAFRVVDGRTELAAPDLELVRLLMKTGKPLFLAVNKIDSDKQESLTADFHRLRVKKVFPLSAEHGHGIDDLLDAFLEILPPQEKREEEDFLAEDPDVTGEQAQPNETVEGIDEDAVADSAEDEPTTTDQRPTTAIKIA